MKFETNGCKSKGIETTWSNVCGRMLDNNTNTENTHNAGTHPPYWLFNSVNIARATKLTNYWESFGQIANQLNQAKPHYVQYILPQQPFAKRIWEKVAVRHRSRREIRTAISIPPAPGMHGQSLPQTDWQQRTTAGRDPLNEPPYTTHRCHRTHARRTLTAVYTLNLERQRADDSPSPQSVISYLVD